jgi:predicted RNA-binding Zn-ribbon protein involved in translation (DUF1610 family)
MKVTAKCHNYTGCVLAYRGENIEIDSGAALVCPECGKAVVLTKSSNSWMKTTLILSAPSSPSERSSRFSCSR